jgi:TolB protein
MMPSIFRKFLFLLCLLAAAAVNAQLSIEITGAGANRIPVAIPNFAGDPAAAQVVTSTIRSDLERSGLFRIVDAGGTPLDENASVNFGDWKGRGADALAAGSLARGGDGRMEARFRHYDVQKGVALGGAAYVTGYEQLRAAGHRIADYIYEKLTGEKGVFSTRVAYVVKSGGQFKLQIADADGQGAATALTSNEPIISPVWSPDGSKVAYVSFEKKKPVIYVHSLASGQRVVAANFKGSNSAPDASWPSSFPRTAIRRSTRSTPTAAASSASRSRAASTPSRVIQPTAPASTSPRTAAAARRSTAWAPAAAMPSASPSRAATTSRRARHRTARASPSSPAATAASSSR